MRYMVVRLSLELAETDFEQGFGVVFVAEFLFDL